MTNPSNNASSEHTAFTPEACDRILLTALENADLETTVSLYEPSATLFRKSGATMTGHDEIRASNAALIAIKPKFTIAFIKTTLSGDQTIATTRMKASLIGTAADGSEIHGDIHTLEVLRKQSDGSWRYIIDDPYGSMRENMKERE